MMFESANGVEQSAIEQFEYRLVYLRPSPYSDERMAVGLLANASGRVETRFVSSVSSIELMTRLFGEDGVVQFQFATAELRRSVSRCESIDVVDIPCDLLLVGQKVNAYTRDRAGLLASVLASSSCLVRTEPARNRDLQIGSTPSFPRELLAHVNRLNPLIGQDIFNKTVNIEGRTVDLPIFGSRIFGAPVSFAANDLRMRAESYVAKFVWLRQHLKQQPRVYVLTPQNSVSESRIKSDAGILELRAIADASNVPLRSAESTEELAALIIQEEAA